MSESPPHLTGAPLPGPWGGYRFGRKSVEIRPPPGFSEQTLILIWGPVLLSVPKNTLISRAPRAQGVSGWGRGGPAAAGFSGPSGGLIKFEVFSSV